MFFLSQRVTADVSYLSQIVTAVFFPSRAPGPRVQAVPSPSQYRSPFLALLGLSSKRSNTPSQVSGHQRGKTPVPKPVASLSSGEISASESVYSSASTVRSAVRSEVDAPLALPADPGLALLSLMKQMSEKFAATPPSVPKAAVPPVTPTRAPVPTGSLPNHFGTPWDDRTHARLIDGVRKIIPKINGTIARELSLSDSLITPYLSMAHLTPAGVLAMRDNDQRYSNLKKSKSMDKGEPPTAPSSTPMLEASRRFAPATWDVTKLAEYALAAVDYSLTLTTLVNPALAVPLEDPYWLCSTTR